MTANLTTLLAPFGIDAPSIEFDELVLDSRQVSIHKAFVAVPGHDLDGRDFIPQAISLGAKVIIAEAEQQYQHGEISMREHSLIVHFYQLSQKLSAIAVCFYDNPADKLNIIAVTGTNGKTSTAQLCAQLSFLCGDQAGTIGTLGTGLVDQLTPNINTTPDAISIQKALAKMQLQGARTVALETSSHALVQHRLASLKTDVAVFTNLTRDHLDYHGSMANYAAAKRLLLKQPGLKFTVLNQDDVQSEQWLQQCPDNVQVVMFGFNTVKHPSCQYCIATSVDYHQSGCTIELESSWGNAKIESGLLGHFNVQNLLAAISAQLCLGMTLEQIELVAPQLKSIAGRMEIFSSTNYAPLVVDYAHTPDALHQALVALRKHCTGELWCMFGCGGDRDKGKRPLMGEMAERFADHVLITNDNSRSESAQQIAEDILAGCQQPQKIQIELDRKKAIQTLMKQANKQDLILLAGKGHEDYQVIGDQRLPYDERHYVQQLLEGIEQ
ncbi:UDP-N-acetylmuramoyl-L-alanyl-D-glutamate--2,6-diaminopimelate ligase [Neptunicella sp. SCSIO 80796]|uniref:UDP-N-acetylmuramoyl-L-alanyl-D-glutamate--2, 6-diaminopimelate ligase n=1 Tax=Neptunicella plasticusilytica TaxID=3117012 RepID=UPI003A4D704C